VFYYSGQLNKSNYIELDINDSTWLYGANIFTTMRVYNYSLAHPLTNWQKHLDRLKNSLKKLDWQIPDWQLIERETQKLLQYFPVIRITLFPDGRELIIGRELPNNLVKKQTDGIKGLVCFEPLLQRTLPHHKTGNYLTPWLALQQAQKMGYQEAILTNYKEDWLETSTGNLWGYKEGVWFTPDLAMGILPGIARSMILAKANFPIEVNHWTAEFISDLEAIAYSNSVVEIIPFNTIKIREQNVNYNPNHPAYLLMKKIYNN
jgi:4-amino-4-deoxychorismate lyase